MVQTVLMKEGAAMMRIVLALVLTTTQAMADSRSEPALKFRDWHYELSTDPGGYARGYDLKFREIETAGFDVWVKDLCASACTLVLRNPRACADAGALFGFHEVRRENASNVWERSEAGTKLMWDYYPDKVKARLGKLTPQMVYIKGADLLPACR
jgi:hypothetical protein